MFLMRVSGEPVAGDLRCEGAGIQVLGERGGEVGVHNV
jgi:hypothetical protein